MRMLVACVLAVTLPAPLFASPPEKHYYQGEVKLSSADGKPMGSQVILIEKTFDRDNSTITERAIVLKPQARAEEQIMTFSVKDDNTFTLTDAAKTVEGTGKFFGPAWRWTYFKGTFKHKSGVIIEDENFMADPSIITARHKVSQPNGRVIMYMDESISSISPTTFEILAAALLKK